MDVGTLRAELGKKKLRPVYLFTGDEELLTAEALEELRRTAGGDRGTIRKFTLPDASLNEIVEAQRNLSLLAPVAVIVVRPASKLGEDDWTALV